MKCAREIWVPQAMRRVRRTFDIVSKIYYLLVVRAYLKIELAVS
jgi:hypothetical protein